MTTVLNPATAPHLLGNNSSEQEQMIINPPSLKNARAIYNLGQLKTKDLSLLFILIQLMQNELNQERKEEELRFDAEQSLRMHNSYNAQRLRNNSHFCNALTIMGFAGQIFGTYAQMINPQTGASLGGLTVLVGQLVSQSASGASAYQRGGEQERALNEEECRRFVDKYSSMIQEAKGDKQKISQLLEQLQRETHEAKRLR